MNSYVVSLKHGNDEDEELIIVKANVDREEVQEFLGRRRRDDAASYVVEELDGRAESHATQLLSKSPGDQWLQENETLAEKLALYRDRQVELQPLLDAQKSLEKEIKDHVLATGEVAEIEGASISIRSGYTRGTWDSKALQGYALARPEILAFYKETVVKGSAVIKVEK